MLAGLSITLAAAVALSPLALAQKGGTAGPCGKDNVCAELAIYSGVAVPGIVGDSAGLSAYRDYRAPSGDPCVQAEYRTRYKTLAVNVSRDAQTGCAGARGVFVSFPSATCSYLTASAAGYREGDGVYTALAGGGCSLEVRTPPANPRVTIEGFVPDAVVPQAGDVNLLLNNPHYGEAGVQYSSFAVHLAAAPEALPNGANSTKVRYAGQAVLSTYVNGKLNSRLNQSFGPFNLEVDVLLLP
jgi:hypothetical protein